MADDETERTKYIVHVFVSGGSHRLVCNAHRRESNSNEEVECTVGDLRSQLKGEFPQCTTFRIMDQGETIPPEDDGKKLVTDLKVHLKAAVFAVAVEIAENEGRGCE